MLHVRLHHHHRVSPNFSPVTTTTKLARLISHQISSLRSPIRCRLDCSFRFPLLSLFPISFQRTTAVGFRDVQRADQIRFRYRYNCSQFFSLKFRFQMRFYLLLQSRMSADCADEAASASGAQSSLPAHRQARWLQARAGTAAAAEGRKM